MTAPMTKSRVRYAALLMGVAVAAGAAATVAPQPARAQAQQSGIVGRIEVRGNERIEADTILSYLPIQVGDTIDQAKLDLAVKTLAETQLFSDERIDLQGDTLVVQVVENPIINQVIFEGNSSLEDRQAARRGDRAATRHLHPRQGAGGRGSDHRALPSGGPYLGHRHAQDRQPAAAPRRPDLRDQRRVRRAASPASISRATRYSLPTILRDVVVTKESHWYGFFEIQRQLRPRPHRVRPRTATKVLPQQGLFRLPSGVFGRRAVAGPQQLRRHLYFG